jgi:hypothetical protein
MSAITLAQKKIQTSGDSRAFLETLGDLGLLKESVEEILAREELVDFFKTQKSTRKKTSSDEERLGQYDGNLCDARLWKEKPKSGGLGYDNIQCSSKKVDGCDCLCKKHFKLLGEGKLWTGLITEPRPDEPTKPDGTKMFWSTDGDGNDVVKEKKTRKKSSEPKKKRAPKKTKATDDKEYSTEELMALLSKAKEKKDSLAAAKDAMLKMSDELKEEKEEKEEDDEDEEEDEYEDITVDGTEYQLNKDDNTVIRKDDFSPVGVWNTETGKIDFDDEEE